MKYFLLARSKESSTWRGAILFLTAIGVPIAPEMGEAIIVAGIGLAGLVGMLSPDKKSLR